MTWTRLPDDFTDRPTVLGVGRSARLLHVEALVWCNRLLTDGVLPANVLRRISDSGDVDHDVAELAQAGLWTRLDEQRWQVDWSEQEAADAVQARKQVMADKQKRYRERVAAHSRGDDAQCDARYCKRLAAHAAGDHSTCHPRYCGQAVTRNATGNEAGDVGGLVTPSRPVPSRPVGRDRDSAGGSASATAAAARPQRTRGGWLASIDAAALAVLPWDLGEDCSHGERGGWTRTREGRLSCITCDGIVRRAAQSDDRWSVATLAKRRPDWERMVYPPCVWQQAHAEDPHGVSLAFDLACLVYGQADAAAEPDDVLDLARVMYERTFGRHRLDVAWDEHRKNHDQKEDR